MRSGTYKSNLNKFSKYLQDKDNKIKKCSECDEITCICFVENFKKESEKKKGAK